MPACFELKISHSNFRAKVNPGTLYFYHPPRLQRGGCRNGVCNADNNAINPAFILRGLCKKSMGNDSYPIRDQHGTYFLTFTVVDWTDIFTRPVYKHIITDALNYCVAHKNLEIFAWVLMTNHMHLIVRCRPPFRLSDVVRDFKKFTSKQIATAITKTPESRREWLLHRFQFNAHYTGRAENYKVWQDGNHAISMEGYIPVKQKIDYIHNNPVRQLVVTDPVAYIYSSAAAYAGCTQTAVNITIIDI